MVFHCKLTWMSPPGAPDANAWQTTSKASATRAGYCQQKANKGSVSWRFCWANGHAPTLNQNATVVCFGGVTCHDTRTNFSSYSLQQRNALAKDNTCHAQRSHTHLRQRNALAMSMISRAMIQPCHTRANLAMCLSLRIV